MSTLRGLALVACLVGNIAAAQRFGASGWFVLVALLTVMGAWFVGMLDEEARPEGVSVHESSDLNTESGDMHA